MNEKATDLDPFCGSATCLGVARRLGRRALGIDLGYAEVQQQRLSGVQRRIKC
jgi:DNA modification methylase